MSDSDQSEEMVIYARDAVQPSREDEEQSERAEYDAWGNGSYQMHENPEVYGQETDERREHAEEDSGGQPEAAEAEEQKEEDSGGQSEVSEEGEGPARKLDDIDEVPIAEETREDLERTEVRVTADTGCVDTTGWASKRLAATPQKRQKVTMRRSECMKMAVVRRLESEIANYEGNRESLVHVCMTAICTWAHGGGRETECGESRQLYVLLSEKVGELEKAVTSPTTLEGISLHRLKLALVAMASSDAKSPFGWGERLHDLKLLLWNYFDTEGVKLAHGAPPCEKPKETYRQLQAGLYPSW